MKRWPILLATAIAALGLSGCGEGLLPMPPPTPFVLESLDARDFYLKDFLAVPDFTNHQVLLWSPLPTANTSATGSVGSAPPASANSFSQASAVDSDGTRLAVADMDYHRVLLWSTIPTTATQSANVILGQSNATNVAENGPGLSAASLKKPAGVIFAESKLIVADSGNHRVLIWNMIPLATGAAADVVIGQTSMLANSANQGGAPTAATLNNPTGLTYYNKKLYIADEDNHRVLVFETIPTTNGAGASYVIGQSDSNAHSANAGGTATATTLSSPHGLSADALYLWVADSGNHRVLNFSITTIATGMKAKNVYGQPDLTTSTPPTTASDTTFLTPRKAVRKGRLVYVLDAFQRIVATPFVF